MSTQPAVTGSGGLPHKVAELRRRVKALESGGTVISAIDGAVISPDTINGNQIVAGSITGDEIAANTITAGNISANTITAAEIKAGTITAAEIQAGTITATQIAANTITANNIAAGAITANAIQAGAVTAAAILAGAVTAAALSVGAVTAGSIAADAITANAIQAGAVTANAIAADAVTATAIQAGAITAAKIAAGAITADAIAANAITANAIAAGAITTQALAAGAVTADRIAAGAITANEIDATTLQAMWTNATVITGGTIRGGRFVTSLVDTGSRVDIDSSGLKGYSAAGVQTFGISSGTGVFISADPSSVIPGPALSTAQIGGGNMLTNSSFEQGAQPNDPTDRRLENYGSQYCTATASTAYSYDGSNSVQMVAVGGNPMYIGRRSTYTTAGLVPVIASRKYTLSAHVYNATGQASRQVKMYYYFYDAAYNVIGSDSGVNVNGSPVSGATINTVVGDWVRTIFTTPAAPMGTAFIGFLVHFPQTLTTGETFFVDAIQIERGDVPTAYAPKGDEILYSAIKSQFIGAGEIKANNIAAGTITAQQLTVAFGGPNRLPNPTFANNTMPLDTDAAIPGWTTANAAGQRTQTAFNPSSSDNNSLRLRATATGTASITSQQFNVVAGQKYTFSGYHKGNSGSKSATAQIIYYNSNNVTLTPVAGETSSVTFTPSSSAWQRFVLAETAPTGATYAVMIYSIISAVSGDSHYVDDFQFELGSDASPWGPNPTEILPGTVGPTQITPNSITTNQLTTTNVDTLGIQAVNIASGAITARTIAAGTITADKLTVGIVGSNLLTEFADVDFERSDALSMRGWTSTITGTNGTVNPGAVFARSTAQFYGGAASMIVTTSSTQQGVGVITIPGPDSTGNQWAAGTAYTFSVFVRGDADAQLLLYFGDNAGSVDFATSPAATVTSAWVRRTVTWTPTSNKAAAKLFVRQDGGSGAWYIDNVQVEVGSQATIFSVIGPGQIGGTQILPGSISTSLIAASAITVDKISFSVGGTNLLWNSSFNASPTGTVQSGIGSWSFWAASGTAPVVVSSSTAGPLNNGWRGIITAASTATTGQQGAYQGLGAVIGNAAYSVTGWAQSANNRQFTMAINWYATGNVLISQSKQTFQANSTWKLFTAAPMYAPSNAVSGTAYFWFENVPANESNSLAYLKVEQGEIATAWTPALSATYIDGNAITAATIRTSVGNTKAQMDSTGFFTTRDGGMTKDVYLTGTSGLDFRQQASSIADPPRQIRWLNATASVIALATAYYDSSSAYNTLSFQTYISGTSYSGVEFITQRSGGTDADFFRVNEGGVTCGFVSSGATTSVMNTSGDLVGYRDLIATRNLYANGGGILYLTVGGIGTISWGNSYNTMYTGSGVAAAGYTVNSDASLKTNIATAFKKGSVLDGVKKLTARKFDRKDTGAKGEVGFVAQEIADAFPDLVSKITPPHGPGEVKATQDKHHGAHVTEHPNESAPKPAAHMAFNLTSLVATLVEGLKEATDRIEALETQLAAK